MSGAPLFAAGAIACVACRSGADTTAHPAPPSASSDAEQDEPDPPLRTVGLDDLPPAIGHGFESTEPQACNVHPQQPTVRLRTVAGDPWVREKLRPSIRSMTEARFEAMRACYLRELLVRPAFCGQVGLRFFAWPNGRVTEAEIINPDARDSSFQACLARALRRLRFPRSARRPLFEFEVFLDFSTP